MKPSVRWTKHIKDPKQKEIFVSQLRGAKPVLDVLKQILQEDYEASLKKAQAEDAYKLPSWALFQADKIAEQRTFNNLMSLIHIENG